MADAPPELEKLIGQRDTEPFAQRLDTVVAALIEFATNGRSLLNASMVARAEASKRSRESWNRTHGAQQLQ